MVGLGCDRHTKGWAGRLSGETQLAALCGGSRGGLDAHTPSGLPSLDTGRLERRGAARRPSAGGEAACGRHGREWPCAAGQRRPPDRPGRGRGPPRCPRPSPLPGHRRDSHQHCSAPWASRCPFTSQKARDVQGARRRHARDEAANAGIDASVTCSPARGHRAPRAGTPHWRPLARRRARSRTHWTRVPCPSPSWCPRQGTCTRPTRGVRPRPGAPTCHDCGVHCTSMHLFANCTQGSYLATHRPSPPGTRQAGSWWCWGLGAGARCSRPRPSDSATRLGN